MLTEQNSPTSFKVTLKLVFSLSLDIRAARQKNSQHLQHLCCCSTASPYKHTISQRCFGDMMIYVGGVTGFYRQCTHHSSALANLQHLMTRKRRCTTQLEPSVSH